MFLFIYVTSVTRWVKVEVHRRRREYCGGSNLKGRFFITYVGNMYFGLSTSFFKSKFKLWLLFSCNLIFYLINLESFNHLSLALLFKCFKDIKTPAIFIKKLTKREYNQLCYLYGLQKKSVNQIVHCSRTKLPVVLSVHLSGRVA